MSGPSAQSAERGADNAKVVISVISRRKPEEKKRHIIPTKESPYTLFQNGRHFSFLLFACKLALVASFKEKYSFEFRV